VGGRKKGVKSGGGGGLRSGRRGGKVEDARGAAKRVRLPMTLKKKRQSEGQAWRNLEEGPGWGAWERGGGGTVDKRKGKNSTRYKGELEKKTKKGGKTVVVREK